MSASQGGSSGFAFMFMLFVLRNERSVGVEEVLLARGSAAALHLSARNTCALEVRSCRRDISGCTGGVWLFRVKAGEIL